MPQEPIVYASQAMPRDYVFVPKGNVYMTSHCRKETEKDGKVVFQVISDSASSKGNKGGKNQKQKPKHKQKQVIGIRVPRHIQALVAASHAATAGERAEAVRKRDNQISTAFRTAIEDQFPKIPRDMIPRIVNWSTKKKSGRVGRTGTREIQEKALLAVRAHVRHVYTDYDKLLRRGMSRHTAREQVDREIDAVLRGWGQRRLPPSWGGKGGRGGKEGGDAPDRKGEAGRKRPEPRDRRAQKKAARQSAIKKMLGSRVESQEVVTSERDERLKKRNEARNMMLKEEEEQIKARGKRKNNHPALPPREGRPRTAATRGMGSTGTASATPKPRGNNRRNNNNNNGKRNTEVISISSDTEEDVDDDDEGCGSGLEGTTAAMFGTSLDDDRNLESDSFEWSSEDGDSCDDDDDDDEDRGELERLGFW